MADDVAYVILDDDLTYDDLLTYLKLTTLTVRASLGFGKFTNGIVERYDCGLLEFHFRLFGA